MRHHTFLSLERERFSLSEEVVENALDKGKSSSRVRYRPSCSDIDLAVDNTERITSTIPPNRPPKERFTQAADSQVSPGGMGASSAPLKAFEGGFRGFRDGAHA
jgi:hypothetical protein